MATATATMINETSFVTKPVDQVLRLLKAESFDRLDSVIDELPKYKAPFLTLIDNFTIEDMLSLINTIFRDHEFKTSVYYKIYDTYFDEIEELIHKM
jgi:hypothetical protein